MGEGEPPRVQKRPIESKDRTYIGLNMATDAAVGRVSDDRMPDGAQVHANLMCSARGDRDVDQRDSREVPRAGHSRDGGSGASFARTSRRGRPGAVSHPSAGAALGPPRGGRCHPFPIVRVASDRRVDSPACLNEPPNQRDILLLDFAIVELAR